MIGRDLVMSSAIDVVGAMPEYVYHCGGGHEIERLERMEYGTAVICAVCQGTMWRVPQPLRIGWGGLKPSAGEISPAVQAMIDNAPAERDRLAAMKEYHVNNPTGWGDDDDAD